MFILIVGTNLVIDEKVTNRMIIPIAAKIKLREIIFIGSPKFILNSRKKTIQISKKFFNDWNLSGIMQSENDPFFTNDYEFKAKFQRNLKMKYEYLAFLNKTNKIAIMSSNIPIFLSFLPSIMSV